MCGVAAIFAYSPDAPAVSPGDLLAVSKRMASRGPDGFGEWFDKNRRVGLAHRRLSLVDLSINGAQPMLSQDGRYAITFNGEIYNYRALRASLEKQGVQFQSGSDTEVLLHLYIRRQEGMLQSLRGMYAFAIWDNPRRGLFVARDPFGIKPLYIADDGRTFRCASQVKALVLASGVDTSPEPAGHAGFFLWGHVPEPWTLHRGVKAAPPGASLWIDESGVKNCAQFASVPKLLELTPPAPPETAPRKVLHDALADSIRHHLIADVPVACFLSAGLDSGVLASLAAEQRAKLKSITLGFTEFKGTPEDETILAEVVARQCNFEHQNVWISREEFEAETEHLFKEMDQPTTDGVNTYFVSLAARRAGVKAALSGLGGDELFGGYPSFKQVPRTAAAFAFAKRHRQLGLLSRRVLNPLLSRVSSPKYAGLLEYGHSFEGAYLLRRAMFMPWEIAGLIGKQMAEEGLERLATIKALGETIRGLSEPHEKVMALEMSWYMRNQLLRDADWAGMAHSMEIRVPLVDWEVLKVAAAQTAAGRPPSKQDMAHTPETPLPDAVLNRRKTGFRTPVREWIIAADKNAIVERGLRGWAKYVYARFARN